MCEKFAKDEAMNMTSGHFSPRAFAAAAGLVLTVGLNAAHAQLSIEDPWVKGAAQGQMATAAYMTLKATQAIKLTGAESPVAGIVEIHQMSMGPNDAMTMRAVPQLDIAAGQSVELKPGGLHIMLMDLNKTPIKPGQTVPITLLLQTADGKTVKQPVSAAVRPLTARDGKGDKGDGGHKHH